MPLVGGGHMDARSSIPARPTRWSFAPKGSFKNTSHTQTTAFWRSDETDVFLEGGLEAACCPDAPFVGEGHMDAR